MADLNMTTLIIEGQGSGADREPPAAGTRQQADGTYKIEGAVSAQLPSREEQDAQRQRQHRLASVNYIN